MRYFIDGNNLMHRLGLVQKNMTQAKWRAAHQKLISWLARLHLQAEVCVFFDAQTNPSQPRAYSGIQIRAALPPDTADDLIKSLVNQDPDPKELIVVSNDAEVRNCGRNRGVKGLKIEDFLDTLVP